MNFVSGSVLIHQYNTCWMHAAVIEVQHAFYNRLRLFFSCYYQQRTTTVLTFAAFFQNCFPSCTHQIGYNSIDHTGQNNRRSGDLISFPNQKQVKYTKNNDVYHILNCFSNFRQITTFHNVLEGVIKEHDHHLDQCEYDGFVSVNCVSIWIQTVMSQKITHNKSKLKADDIKDHKIQVLQPACS